MNRPKIYDTLMETAKLWAQRATCPDLQVGCVLATPDGHIISTGYNGTPHGMPHCIESHGGCMENDVAGFDHRVVHAEVNAIAEAAKLGKATAGSFAYITTQPCYKCAALLYQSGVIKIVYIGEVYETYDFPIEFYNVKENK